MKNVFADNKSHPPIAIKQESVMWSKVGSNPHNFTANVHVFCFIQHIYHKGCEVVLADHRWHGKWTAVIKC
jgi:hypothetical protein